MLCCLRCQCGRCRRAACFSLHPSRRLSPHGPPGSVNSRAVCCSDPIALAFPCHARPGQFAFRWRIRSDQINLLPRLLDQPWRSMSVSAFAFAQGPAAQRRLSFGPLALLSKPIVLAGPRTANASLLSTCSACPPRPSHHRFLQDSPDGRRRWTPSAGPNDFLDVLRPAPVDDALWSACRRSFRCRPKPLYPSAPPPYRCHPSSAVQLQ
ncbi:uncharacterized protein BJ171DRAFT_148510 [Polychytrium aggregatum]|uniref:uncharacterized protein n=1 Tax=Polychytrium aggregatum TaxID=110093 RepID=UPI0022FE914F|nr:uncharacterized protein BJ171DRAFT_148510 [Polychytrium aggregatum]KAI9203258.1 hypothetical protein BJ171DRAFT_148510 [Polychytrium aggregatum]